MNLYEKYGIYELRTIAREKGVKSPTIYKKSELIDKIEKIDLGLIKPNFNYKKVGRPTNKTTYNNPIFISCENCPVKNQLQNLLNDIYLVLDKHFNN